MSPDETPAPLDLSALVATPLTDPFMVPNHNAGTEPVDAPKPQSSMRQRLREMSERRKADEQPRARNVKPTKAKKSVPNVPGQFVEPLTNLYNGMAFAMMPFKPAVTVALLAPSADPTEDNPNPPTVAENCARAWDEAAQRSESVRRFLDGMVGVSVWGQLAAAHAPLVGALLQGTSVAERFNPAAAMEAMLKRQAEQEQNG